MGEREGGAGYTFFEGGEYRTGAGTPFEGVGARGAKGKARGGGKAAKKGAGRKKASAKRARPR